MTETDESADARTIIEAVIREAQESAVVVGRFLQSVDSSIGRCLSHDILLKLDAWTRIYRWERAGVFSHLDAGLPGAAEVLADVEREFRGEPAVYPVQELGRRVLVFAMQRMSWRLNATHLEAEIIDTTAPEELLDALARLLWANRHLSLDQS
ncbi:MAG: hypothetical protein HQ518_10230 [Rhodopirellula sp.]|nr:hypothetical protein [Rhodopirellula sp.]